MVKTNNQKLYIFLMEKVKKNKKKRTAKIQPKRSIRVNVVCRTRNAESNIVT